MDNIKYAVEENQLIIEFISDNDDYGYALFFQRDNLKFPFQLSKQENNYHFSCSLSDLSKFIENRITNLSETNLEDTNEEVNSFKFTVQVQYMKFNEETNSYTLEIRSLNIKNKTWNISNLIKKSFDDKVSLKPYITKKGALALLVNKDLSDRHYYMHKTISKMKVLEDSILIKGNLSTRFFDIDSASIQLIERGGNQAVSFPVKIDPNKKQKENSFTRRFKYSWQMKSSEIKEFLESLSRTEELSIDLFFLITLKETDQILKFRVGTPRFLTNYFMKGELAVFSEKTGKWLSLVPYFTIKGVNLSFTYNQYDQEAYEYFRKNKKNWRKVRNEAKEKPIWIVGERSYKAQDNGYHFFKYLRTNHPEIDAYYVIQKNSPERRNIEKLGNIIDFKSKVHFEKVIKADYICGTHHPDSLYPIRSKEYIKNISAKKVFLQHGVFGTKNITSIYAKWINEFYTDLFITSSEKERQLAIVDMGYHEDEVVVTGLSRFETLFKKDIPLKRQVLIIPTWRDWITNNEIFEESEYFYRYKELLFDPRLKEISEKYGVEFVFCLHPNMQDYVDYFKEAPVTIIRQGDRDVQDLIKESSIMLTDYSSVAFDFSFLHKPVIYYQFDRKRFLGKVGSHLDLDNELPGDVDFEENHVISDLIKICENNFSMEKKYIERADKFIKYRDQDSNQRIFEAVNNIPKKNKFKKFFTDDPLMLKIFSRYRRSRFYFPTMKLYYNFLRVFGGKVEKRIVFESGLGKRYEDSPRKIYEKMVENREDFEYIWIMNNNEPLEVNPQTKIVKRLSPNFYKYLATSKYWVNNQNFPTYLTKPKQTRYLQTWHGTPVKKMQHDQEHIEGRDSGYLDRVTHAKNQWSALVSPSPYATKAFRSAFQYDGEIIEKGYPRNDIFYEENLKDKGEQIRRNLGIETNKKVILYAPTFRDNRKKGKKFISENKINFRIFERRLGEKYVLLIREHVLIANKIKIPKEFQHNIINVSNYPNIQELMIASDMLVTDYSSVMFDYLNLHRPIYFYCYDLEDYADMRGFYFDFEKEVPGPIVKNSSNLCREIIKSNQYWNKYGKKYRTFENKFIPLDGSESSEQVYRLFF